MYAMRRLTLVLLFASLFSTPARALVTWGDFVESTPPPGAPTTVSLGGGSTVQVTVTTGGTQGITGSTWGTLGALETGLGYTALNMLGIFNGGGQASVHTVVQFSNFQPGAHHVRGFIGIGALNGFSSPVTVTSSLAGAVQTWTQVGSAFDFGPANSFPITWNAPSGTFTTTAAITNDSKVIVLDVGSLAQYSTITLSLEQWLDDGVVFVIGEETAATEVPALGPPAWTAAALLLAVSGVVAARLPRGFRISA